MVTSGGQGENGGGAPAIVHGGVSAQAIADNMKEFAQAIRAQAQAGEVSSRTAEERVTFIQELLDDLSIRVNVVFTEVLNRVPNQAKATIQSAMENAVLGFQGALAAKCCK